jgi:methylphosphotriester-DNA--protein-cysteine methyltransferase
MRALELLAEGAAVTRVAFALGYDSVRVFIAPFKQTLGGHTVVLLQSRRDER